MSSKKSDKTFDTAKKKINEALESIDLKKQGAILDLCKLTEALVGIRDVELKTDEGTYGSGLPGDNE